jgi:hypothetical protein
VAVDDDFWIIKQKLINEFDLGKTFIITKMNEELIERDDSFFNYKKYEYKLLFEDEIEVEINSEVLEINMENEFQFNFKVSKEWSWSMIEGAIYQ